LAKGSNDFAALADFSLFKSAFFLGMGVPKALGFFSYS
jgi:hypothetical protein